MRAIDLVIDRPFWSEAREYCDRNDVTSLDEAERVRLSMCQREFRIQMEPFWNRLARLRVFDHLGAEYTAGYLEAERLVNEIAIITAQKLGLHLSPLPHRGDTSVPKPLENRASA